MHLWLRRPGHYKGTTSTILATFSIFIILTLTAPAMPILGVSILEGKFLDRLGLFTDDTLTTST